MAIGSPLATLHLWSPNHYNGRKYPITRITIHHVAGKLKAKTIGEIFLKPERKASSTYGIGYDAEIAQYVDEADAPWTSSNYDNDNRAITIEVSNSATGGEWPVSDECLEALIKLLVDCVQRNPGIKEINFTGDKTGNLTMHNWFANTLCPGPYLEKKFPYIAEEVNKRLAQEKSPSNTSPSTSEDESKPEATVLYRVQTGAYSKQGNAVNLQAKLLETGFESIMVQADGLYKVQVGAFSKLSNAEAQADKLTAAGFKTFITTKAGDLVEEALPELNKLDRVKLAKNAPVYGSNKTFQGWVYDTVLYVRDVSGDRITVSTVKTGDITGVVHRKYLTKV